MDLQTSLAPETTSAPPVSENTANSTDVPTEDSSSCRCSCFGKERKEGEECSYLLNVRQFAESETSRYGGHRRRLMVSYRNIWHRCCCNAPPLADACRPSNPSSFLNSWYGSPFRTRATSMVPPPPSLSLLCCVLKQIPHFQCSKL